ncbi:MAG: alpha/beta hydrolase, partial [Polymorphobacter sp.]
RWPMSLAEIAALRAALAARPVGAPLAARRAGFEAMMARASLVPGTSARRVQLSSALSAELITTPGADASRLLVWLHGGQFALGSSASYRSFAARASAAAGIAVLVPDYRLAPENLFPAAHDDAETALDWALANAATVAIGGDSAGANLAVAALQRHVGARPAALWLLSPYLDLTHKAPSIAARAPVDPFVDPAEMDAVAARYLGGASPADPRASPLFGPMENFPPCLVQVGSDEALFDDASRFAGQWPDAVFQQWEGMIHVWPLFADTIEEGRWAIAQAGSFLQRRLF